MAGGVREVEAGLVLVPQGEEVGGGDQGVVDGMQGLAGDLGGTGDGRARPNGRPAAGWRWPAPRRR